jgi:glutathione synthase/RimK-type ligase-like ATP-grasp enzyme
VWWRRPSGVTIPAVVVDPQAKRHIVSSHDSLLNAFIYSLGDRVVNTLRSSIEADEKATQIQAAVVANLLVPDTLISNDFGKICDFCSQHDEVVVKPLTNTYGCFPVARVVSLAAIESSRQPIELCPAIYQRVVRDAIDLRVTVVGKKIFVARIAKNNPQAISHIDWRLDASHECCTDTIPDEYANRLLGLMEMLGLQYGAIDIRRTPDGELFFLEVNTSGQYLWVEVDTKMQISAAIASLLTCTANK